jgi:hypothetical protein
MADLNLYIDTQNRRLVESFTSRNTFTLPKFYAGDSGIVTRLHVLEPSTTSEIDRPYAYIDPTGFSYSLTLGLLDQAPDGGTFTTPLWKPQERLLTMPARQRFRLRCGPGCPQDFPQL